MQLVIDIDDELYEGIETRDGDLETEYVYDELVKAIDNGISLPREHGRLKDIDAFISKVNADRKHAAYSRSWTADDVLAVLNNSYAPTIIEADKWYEAEVITCGNCMICGKELDEGLFFCKECEAKVKSEGEE